MSINNLVQKVAEAICPDWWGELHMRAWNSAGEEIPSHVLDNYPGQHVDFRERSLNQGKAATKVVLDEVAKWMAANDLVFCGSGYGGQYFPAGITMKNFARENGIEL